MSDYEETPMIMFPPDTLVERMEQVRKITDAIHKTTPNSKAMTFLEAAAQLLLDSCSLKNPNEQHTAPNVTKLH